MKRQRLALEDIEARNQPRPALLRGNRQGLAFKESAAGVLAVLAGQGQRQAGAGECADKGVYGTLACRRDGQAGEM
ncbi:MAG: hypothetical protein E2O77_09250 [Caldithrix sp.]|nr:MAG: hypothetical protein E2O77_09250 [Caldithrix sp.]